MGIHFERRDMLQAMRQGVLSTDATALERKCREIFINLKFWAEILRWERI